jgi:membrane protein YqaA with SNARE-associated domain
MEVRIGAPRAPEATDAGQLRADVLDLLGRGPARRRTSAVWARVARLVSGPRGLLVAFAWGFAEALSWPVMAEMTLVFLAAAVPSRVPALASSIVAGSLAGVLLQRPARRGGLVAARSADDRPHAGRRARRPRRRRAGVLHQALSGIPVKLYARAAGELGTDPWALLAWAGVDRGLRMAAVGLLVWLVARGCTLVAPLLRHLPGAHRPSASPCARDDRRGVVVARNSQVRLRAAGRV